MIAEIHASKFSRVMTCAGSLFFENLPEQETNDAAKEGTAFGEYVEHLLKNEQHGNAAKNGVHFDNEMKFYGKYLHDEITNRAQRPILCETKVDWLSRSGIWIRAKYDASYVGTDGKLYIDDFKYGYGLVEVKENWQLLCYAIGEVLRRGERHERIVLRILQPRPHHEDGDIREWEITYDTLLYYKELIEERLIKIAAGFKELVTSTKCKYCPAAAEACTAFNRAFQASLDYTLNDEFRQDQLTEKEIAFQLDLVDRATDIIKIKKGSLEQLGIDRIKRGKIIPNWMTETSLGNRQWKKEVSPQAILVMTGIKVTEEKMLSPKQAEVLGVDKKLVQTLVDRPVGGMKLVRKDHTALGNAIFGNTAPQHVGG